ncbi:MAG: hypothetical protein U0237_14570 [Thermoleophilia bacterium]
MLDIAADLQNPEHQAVGRDGALDLINAIPGLTDPERVALAIVAGITKADALLAQLDGEADLAALEASALEKAYTALAA